MKKLIFSLIAFGSIAMMACTSKATTAADQTTDQTEATEAQQAETGVVAELTENVAIEKADLPVVIDFNATWCGPCQQFGPVFHEVAEQYASKAKFISVDVDNCPNAAEQFDVQAIPQISILMPDGTIQSTVGYMDADQFKKFLDENL